jgi:erythritol transport system permease protein
VVVGGAALTGGRGNIRGTLLGAFVIGFLSDGLVIIGISSYWQTVFTGGVIVLAVLLNAVQYRRRVKRPSATDGQSPSQVTGVKAKLAEPARERTAG